MTCQFCGTVNPEFQRNCTECGRLLSDHPDNHPKCPRCRHIHDTEADCPECECEEYYE